MAHVVAHANRIAVRFRIDGVEHKTTIPLAPTAANLRATERTARAAEHRLRSGEDWVSVRAWLRGEQQRASNTLGYYAQHFLDHADVERSTLMGYQTAFNRYWLPFDDRRIDTITRSELEAHLAAFRVGRKTRANAISVLRRIFEVARRDRVIAESPVADWSAKKGQSPEPDPYTEVERDKLLDALQRWPIAHSYFHLAFSTGMRTGELLGLEWRHLAKPYITVEQARVRRVIKRSTKTDEVRRIIVPDEAWSVIERNPTRFRRSFVFLTPEGHPFLDADWLMEHWARAHKLTNVRRRGGMYPWRHTYISLALAAGASLIWVARQAGHDLVTMQARYARWVEGREDADREELRRVFGDTNRDTTPGR